MELWIRSQNKKLLCKVDSLFIEEELYKRKGKYRIMANNGWLGEYNTLERALEILDEMQEIMTNLADSDLKIIQYEMPKD